MYKYLFIVVLLFLPGCIHNITDNNDIDKKISYLYQIGETNLNERNFTTALSAFMDLDKLAPDNPQVQYKIAISLSGKKEWQLAYEKMVLVTKKDRSSEKLTLFGVICLELSKWDEALAIFREIEKDLLYNGQGANNINMGVAFLGKKDFVNAQVMFEKGLNTSYSRAAGMLGLMKLYIETNKHDKALFIGMDAIKTYPKSADINYYVGYIYYKIGQKDLANKYMKKVIEFGNGRDISIKAQNILSQLNTF